MNDYKMTIGLEIHAEMKTKSKMFCGCANVSALEAEAPNTYICPICMGNPGTLPVINKEAVGKVLLVGTALGSKLADFTEFDRKNYFYPDIPKGYQISQYKYPLVSGGSLAGVTLTRIHLEEDTARSGHDTPGFSLVDFNRAGVPLMELVTEPVIHSAEQAVTFAKELQLLLQYLGVSDANMEKGEMRVEVNISVSKTEPIESQRNVLGTKVEVKNINSFRAVGKAIEFEFDRQCSLIERGEKVVQETRGWDENKSSTFPQRLKESAHDYRYFPEPDLPKLYVSEIKEFSGDNLKSRLVELPAQKRERYVKQYGLKTEDIEMYINNKLVADFFESVIPHSGLVSVQTISNYITSDLVGLSKNIGASFSFGMVTPENFAKLFVMLGNGELSSRGAKDVLKVMFEIGGDPETIANQKGLVQKNDTDELKKIISEILGANTKVIDEYKSGKDSVLQFLVGQGMKATKGSANPELLKKIILELIK
jgi:aspartyl-tRNA(Asn)/glutamyl-tRNA(Gln) amidotransferase subunit B